MDVIIDGLQDNPCCQHGPTVLFCRTDLNNATTEKYYACTASRDGQCPFKVKASDIGNFHNGTVYLDTGNENFTENYDEVSLVLVMHWKVLVEFLKP